MAPGSAVASSALERRIWNPSRCADLLPTPGSFFSSSMRRAIGSAKRDIGGSGDLVIGSSGDLKTACKRVFRSPDHPMARSSDSWQPSQHAAHGGLHAVVNFL